MPFYAHSDHMGRRPEEPGSCWQPLSEHLVGVATRAVDLARAAGGGEDFVEAARWAGLLHDLGKYQDDFQRMLLASAQGTPKARVPHSAHGAAIAMDAGALDVAFAVAGHHAGLAAPQGARSALKERCDEARAVARTLLQVARADFAARSAETAAILRAEPPAVDRSLGGAAADLRIRFIASCLIDADRLDTAGLNTATRELHNANVLLERLQDAVQLRAERTPVSQVREARRRVFEACLQGGDSLGRLFSLTVPTGGGKTLASMAFALQRIRFGLARRVIVVIPYLSIIEQSAAVFAEVFGADMILEHHSGAMQADDDEAQDSASIARRLAQENWDAPIVVTTSVRFFETLFSNRARDLRRLHNIGRSVVILDEVQTLPRELIGTLLSMIRGLADQFGTTFLFCTATQPAFERQLGTDVSDRSAMLRWPRGTVRELMPEPRALFDQLRRVEVHWACAGPQAERWPWHRVVDEMEVAPRVLTIVNLRKHAAAIYERLRTRATVRPDRVWYLTSRLCAAHRLDVLASIRRALEAGDECRVVATQLVEAGVDIDFPVVLRALGPLDSIAQAAGRCDREGILTAQRGRPAGRLVVFEPDLAPGERATPRGAYSEGATATREMVDHGRLRIDDPAHLQRYFERLFHGAEIDAGELEGLRKGLNFPEVAKRFRLIDEETTPVLVRYRSGAGLIEELLERRALSLSLLRRLQRYQIGLYETELRAAQQVGAVMPAWPGSEIQVCTPGCYDQHVGFRMESDALLEA